MFGRGLGGRGFGRGLRPRGGGWEMLMLLQLAQQAWHFLQQLPYVPFATLAIIILNVAVHLNPPLSTSRACISADKLLGCEAADVLPLFLSSALTHADDYHLGVNMLSLLHKGGQLEAPWRYGTPATALLVALLTLLTSALYTPVALAGAVLLGDESLRSSCAVGFSGVLFALKVILQADAEGQENVHGFAVSARWAAWAELLVLYLLVPQSSFLGHLAGILAGLVWLAWERSAWPRVAAAVPQLRAALAALRAARIPAEWWELGAGGVAWGGGGGDGGGDGGGGGGGGGGRFYGGGVLGGGRGAGVGGAPAAGGARRRM